VSSDSAARTSDDARALSDALDFLRRMAGYPIPDEVAAALSEESLDDLNAILDVFVAEREGDRVLADDLRRVLAEESFGLPGRELARRLRRRRADVLAQLQSDPRFKHSGRTRGSRWRLAEKEGRGPNGNRPAAHELRWDELDPSGVPVIWRRALSASP
jgi:hypothetical protein